MRFEVIHNRERNRIQVCLEGLFSEEDARQAADQVVAGIESLLPGGDMINDISRFRPVSQASLAEIRRVGDAISRCLVRRVVRVVGVSPTAAMQVQREAENAGGYAAYRASTLAEAEAFLDTNSSSTLVLPSPLGPSR